MPRRSPRYQAPGRTIVLLLALVACAGAQDPLALLPRPERLSIQKGSFRIGPETVLCGDDAGRPIAAALGERLEAATGWKLPITAKAPERGCVRFSLDPARQELGREGYQLEIRSDRVEVTAFQQAGLFYGMQTLRQLLPPGLETGEPVKAEWRLQALSIQDRPRFPWRGYMKDVSRTFFSVDVIKKYLDVMALYKMNVFHWHLTDDQGWRIEIRRRPRLTDPLCTTFHPSTKQPPERSGFYTREHIKEVVAYAKARHITIVPEIDVPGHSWATLLAYPELGVNQRRDPAFVFPFLASWGYWGNQFTPNTLDPTKEEVYGFLDDVFTELAELFPGEYVHFGGDEVRHETWEKAPHVQAFMREKGMKKVEELQSHFVDRVARLIRSKGRKPIGWNDILAGADHLTRDTAIMSWLGEDAIKEAARRGFDTVATPTDPLYFDITQESRHDGTMCDLAYENINALKAVYAYEPTEGLKAAEEARVLGIQANMWPALAQEVKDVNVQNFPRLLGVAEIAWIPKGSRDWDAFQKRIEAHMSRLDALKVDTFRPGGYTIAAWTPSHVPMAFQTRTWDVTRKVYAPGRAHAGFYFTGGAHFLEIQKVELLENDRVVAVDEHPGLADTFRGTNRTKTFQYVLNLDRYQPGAVYTLRATLRGKGGTQSNGNITFNLCPARPFHVVEPR